MPVTLCFSYRACRPAGQFLIDIIIPRAARGGKGWARLSGVDSDTFRYCSFIVEDEYGLLPHENGSPNEKR